MIRNRLHLSLVTLCLLTATPGEAASREPIGDIFVHDPTLLAENGQQWVFGTGMGIQTLYRDRQTNVWRRATPVFKDEPLWWAQEVPQHNRMDVWAPDLNRFNGRVWLYYSISSFGSNNSAIGLASASSVAAADWRDEGMMLRSGANDDFNAIDPDLVIDAEGQPWLSFGSFWSGLKLMRVDPASMRPVGERIALASRPAGIEAPSIRRHGRYYYLFASIDKCCQGSNSSYKIIYGRSTQIAGPYLDRSGIPLLEGGGSLLEAGGKRWRGPGGADLVDGLIVRHAYDDDDLGKPKLRINRLKWRQGWPEL